MVTIPAELLQSLAAPGGGQVALVIGAGCSKGAPTNMPLAGELAEDVERQLVLNGRLQSNQCPDPTDLAALASLVFELSGSQAELVRCFPIAQMRLARPNLGYKLMVALMAERAISHVLSLNFDLAVQHAAAELGVQIVTVVNVGEDVPVRATLVQLHGNANCEPDQLILREDVINAGWIGQWSQVVAQQILAAPTVVFAGLGSAAPVLTATIKMIQAALGGNKALFQADVVPFAKSGFAAQLDIPERHYICGTWDDVLRKLSERIAARQVDALLASGQALLLENLYDQPDRDRFASLTAKLSGLSLLALGKIRAFAELDGDQVYRPHAHREDELITEPMVRLAHLSERYGLDAIPTSAGTWILKRGDQQVAQLVLATGGGVRRMAALEPRAKGICNVVEEHSANGLDFILVGGLNSDGPALTHVDLIADEDPADLIGGLMAPMLVSANNEDYIDRVGRLLNVA